MKNLILTLLIAVSFTGTSLKAQIIKPVEDDIVRFVYMGGDIFHGFTSFSGPTQIKLAATALAIGGAYSLDYNIKDLFGHAKSNFSDNLFSVDKVYGSGYTLIGIAGLYGYGIIFHNEDVRKIGLQTIEAVGYAGLITSVLKAVVGRSRPYTGEGKSKFRPFNVHAATTSFPSGHSTVAFAVSTVLANNTHSTVLKVLCYTASSLVAFSRIYRNAHWFSDVFTGGAIGYFVGDFVSNNSRYNLTNRTNFSFYFSPGTVGFVMNF